MPEHTDASEERDAATVSAKALTPWGWFSGRSLAARQVRIALLVGVVLGFATSAGQIVFEARTEVTSLDRSLTETLQTVERTAAQIAYNLDGAQGRSLVAGLIQNPRIAAARLVSDRGLVLGAAQQPRAEAPDWVRTLARMIFGPQSPRRMALFRSPDGQPAGELGVPSPDASHYVGMLSLTAETTGVTRVLLERSWQAFVAGMIRNTLFAFLLTWIFFRTTTRPTLGLAAAIDAVDPRKPGAIPVRPPRGHATSELGTIAHTVQRLLDHIDYENRRRAEAERSLAFSATHDATTGLLNRSALDSAVEARIAQHMPVSIFLFDITAFRAVNENLGRAVGDAALSDLATRLARQQRPGELLSRLPGGEFAVVVSGDEDEVLARVASRLMATVTEPMRVHGHRLQLRATIGAASFGYREVRRGEASASVLLRRADIALSASKRAQGRFQRYDRGMEEANERRHLIESRLREGLTHAEFHLLYQPKVDLASGQAVGVEALLRWNHPVLGSISPGEFVIVAEQTGLIIDIGRWVIDAATEQIAAWERDHGRSVPVAINVSAVQLEEEGAVARAIEAAVARHGIDARMIEIELTETTMMSGGVMRAMAALREIAALGIRVSVDDFGTGYSSLAYLTRLPLSMLKIDRSFIRHLPHDRECATLVRTIIQMAHELSLKVVAEGVETDDNIAFLTVAGCDIGQGFRFAKPMDAGEVLEFFDERNRSTAQAGSNLPDPQETTAVARAVGRFTG